jgi:Uma2 family endonuclease
MSTVTAPIQASTPRLAVPAKYANAAQWLHELGDVPLDRIVMDPWPGTATEQDLLIFVERDKRLVELIDGTLVEKPVGLLEALIAARLISMLGSFVYPRKLGLIAGADATLRMASGRVRLPDVTFISAADLPGGAVPSAAIPLLPPTLAVEVLSKGNTPLEMQQKIKEYFQSGAKLVWLIDPPTRTVAVYTGPSETPAQTLNESDSLGGGNVLPGFTITVSDLFKSEL